MFIDKACFHVVVSAKDTEVSFNEQFARQQDAEAAMNAIQNTIDWNGTWDEIDYRITQFGRDKLNQLMMEALQW